MRPVRILLADDHRLVRTGLRRILQERSDWEVVAEAESGREAVCQAVDLQPDVAILDIGMPLLGGIEATRQIVRRAPHTRVLILSMYTEEAYITRAVQAGARGYLLKDSADADLLDAVAAVVDGKSFFSPAAARVLLDDYVRQLSAKGIVDRFDTLTDREREVLQLVAEGKSNKEAAALMSVSPSTIETHRARVMEKLDLHSTAEVVLYAVRKGLIR